MGLAVTDVKTGGIGTHAVRTRQPAVKRIGLRAVSASTVAKDSDNDPGGEIDSSYHMILRIGHQQRPIVRIRKTLGTAKGCLERGSAVS